MGSRPVDKQCQGSEAQSEVPSLENGRERRNAMASSPVPCPSPGAVVGPPRMLKEGLTAFEDLQGESRVSADQGSW